MHSTIKSFLIFLLCCTCATAIPREQFEAPGDDFLASIPEFVLPQHYSDRQVYPLPDAVDNTTNDYMPPYRSWSIRGWSCANAAAIANCFAYEMNYTYNTSASGDMPGHPYMYTYHFLNSGNIAEGGDGWMFIDAWETVKETGCPSTSTYGGFEWIYQACPWMDGYDKYYSAMKNRIDEYYKIDGQSPQSVELIQQYLYDHAAGASEGGLLVFQCSSSGWEEVSAPSISARSGERMLAYLGQGEGGHTMTIAGYDNGVGYDYNGDGNLTNDLDINSDGVVDLKDREKGSWLVVNNWSDGLYWVPYRLMALPYTEQGAGTGSGNPIMFCTIEKDYTPQLTFKMSITHSERQNIQILTGASSTAGASEPEVTKNYWAAFNYAGGSYPMGGMNQGETIETGLDLTPLLTEISEPREFYLQINSQGGQGEISGLTLMDYTGSEVNEIPCGNSSVSFGSGTTILSVPWDGTASRKNKVFSGSKKLPRALKIIPGVISEKTGRVQIVIPGSDAASTKNTVICIHDINGRLIYKEHLSSLDHGSAGRITWNVNNSQQLRTASGRYFVTVYNNSRQSTLSKRLTAGFVILR